MRLSNSRTGVGGRAGVNLTQLYTCANLGSRTYTGGGKGNDAGKPLSLKETYEFFSLKKLGFRGIASFYVKLQSI